jgi:hypothetical protein
LPIVADVTAAGEASLERGVAEVISMTARNAVLVAVSVGLFAAVTWVARHSSSDSFRQYGSSGTWMLGLVAAAASFAVAKIVLRRSAKGEGRP